MITMLGSSARVKELEKQLREKDEALLKALEIIKAQEEAKRTQNFQTKEEEENHDDDGTFIIKHEHNQLKGRRFNPANGDYLLLLFNNGDTSVEPKIIKAIQVGSIDQARLILDKDFHDYKNFAILDKYELSKEKIRIGVVEVRTLGKYDAYWLQT